MESLRELRVRMKLEVRVWGMDSTGKPFSQVARTVEISGNGARLEGVTCLQQAGEVIGVQHGNQKARFRILWIGENGTAEQGQIGIGCLESGKCIWWQALQDAGDDVGQGPEILSPDAASTIGPPPAATGGAPQAERRRYPRYQCSGKVLLTKEGTEISTSAKLTDIGLGGCYAETFTPLALHTPVEFVIQADELEIPRSRYGANRSSFGWQRNWVYTNDGRILATLEPADCPRD